jgi:predicted Zn-dependent protease
VEKGNACGYYGANRFGQYMGEVPTGNLRCLKVDAGSAAIDSSTPGLEVVSMSGLQVDFYNDYIGGEVRLAYYRDGEKAIPVTGVSITGSLSQVLSSIRLCETIGVHDGYMGPEKALLTGMKIF